MAAADPVRRVLICGFGRFGALHAAAWRTAFPAVRLLIADPDPDARHRAAAAFPDAVVGDDWQALIDQVDIVDVVTPPVHHYDVAAAAIDSGRPVLIEKPAVSSLDEARDLMGRAATHSVPVQVQLVLRGHRLVRRATALMGEGAIGRIIKIECAFDGWKRMRDDSTLLENDGVHFLDLMSVFMGNPPDHADVRARACLNGPVADDIDIDLTFPDDLPAHLKLGIVRAGEVDDPFVPGALTTKKFRLIGDRGNLEIDFNRNRLFLAQTRFTPTIGGWQPEPPTLRWEQPPPASPVTLLSESFRVFVKAVDGEGSVLCDLEAGAVSLLQTMNTIEAAMARGTHPMMVIGRER